VRVALFVDEVRQRRIALLSRDVTEEPRGIIGRERRYLRESRREQLDGLRQFFAGASSNDPTAAEIDQAPGCDRVKPRCGWSGTGYEPWPCNQRARKCLGGKIVGRVPADTPPEVHVRTTPHALPQ